MTETAWFVSFPDSPLLEWRFRTFEVACMTAKLHARTRVGKPHIWRGRREPVPFDIKPLSDDGLKIIYW